MKVFRIICTSLILTFSLLLILKVFDNIKTLKNENYKNKIQNEFSKRLKDCFDFENKNNRRISETMELIEYCLKEYGIN